METNVFPFPSVPHREFPSTFLVLTKLELYYDSVDLVTLSQEINAFIEKEFGHEVREEEPSDFNVVTMTSSQLQVSYSFEDDKVVCTLGGLKYASFNRSAIPNLRIAVRFVETVLRLKSIKGLSITKVNKWGLNREPAPDLYEAGRLVLRSDFLPSEADCTENPLNGRVTKTEKEWSWQPEESVSVFLKRVIRRSSDSGLIEVSLVTKAIKEQLDTSEIENAACVLNDLLFDVYMGAVTQNVVEMMETSQSTDE